jgi:hypothetical protein
MRIILLFCCIILVGCSTNSNSVTEEADVTNVTEIQPDSDFTLASLAGEWHMVTLEDNNWVLFYPCDADNTFVQIKGDSIVIGWGQDATAGKIESWSLNNIDELSLVVNDSYATNTYRVQQTDDGLTQWWLWEDAEGPSYFIPSSEKSNYPTIKQPCKECWEDCEEEQ